jgi:succinyl-CoA synthetase alpha subunit
MAIFVTENTKVIVQGMTGSEGTKHTKRMLKAGTKIVGGVTPGKGGQTVDMDGVLIPVFNSVRKQCQQLVQMLRWSLCHQSLQRQQLSMQLMLQCL